MLLVPIPWTKRLWALPFLTALAAMKPGAYLINIARGEVAREAALIEALRRGHLAGAALDIYERESLPPASLLYALDNVLLLPHCADNTRDALPASSDLFLANLARYLAGAPLLNVVDKQAGY